LIIIIAGAADLAAQELAAGWNESDARLVRPADLSTRGWCHYVGASGRCGSIALGGEVIPETEITGVLTLLPWIDPAELVSIAPDDREYVAAEISAFLLSWLSSLDCVVVNRPMPGCLSGPPWRAAQWIAAARTVGLRVPASSGFTGDVHPVRVTVVGNECLGNVGDELRARSRRLTALAGAELLHVDFDGADADAAFLGASAIPRLEEPAVREAVLGLLHGPVRKVGAFPDLRPWRRAERGW
jgi:hypothetical protein